MGWAKHEPESCPLCASLLRHPQTHRRNLSRALAAGGSRYCERPNNHLLALAEDRHHQRRWQVGGSRGSERDRPDYEPQTDRHPRFQPRHDQGIRRRRNQNCRPAITGVSDSGNCCFRVRAKSPCEAGSLPVASSPFVHLVKNTGPPRMGFHPAHSSSAARRIVAYTFRNAEKLCLRCSIS